MKQEILLDALTAMDGEFLDEALEARAKLLPRAGRRIKPLVIKRAGLAACLAAVLLALPYAKLVLAPHGGAHDPDHGAHGGSFYFASVEAAEEALGGDLLLDRLGELPLTRDILVSSAAVDGGSAPGRDGAVMLQAHFDAGGLFPNENPMPPIEDPSPDGSPDGSLDGSPDKEETDSPDQTPEEIPPDADGWGDEDQDEEEAPPAAAAATLYILFDKDSIRDGYIAGYEEQGLTLRYGDLVVHYSLIRDPHPHGQARFLYGGDLYILDIPTAGDARTLVALLEMMLGEGEGE